MLKRVANLVLFDYHGALDSTLYRQCAILRAGAYTCLWCNATYMTILFELLSSHDFYERVAPDWVLTVAIFIVAGMAAVGTLLMPIMLLAEPLTRDICEALTSRGLPLPTKRYNADDMPKAVMKMVFWAIAVVFCASFK